MLQISKKKKKVLAMSDVFICVVVNMKTLAGFSVEKNITVTYRGKKGLS